MGILSKILGSGDTVARWLDLIDSFHTSSVEEKRDDALGYVSSDYRFISD